MDFNNEVKKMFNQKALACPLRAQWFSFRMVDESGEGKVYGGLKFWIVDNMGQRYEGILDADGFAKNNECYRGPVLLYFNDAYHGVRDYYTALMERDNYPLPVTELQVRAEESFFIHQGGIRTEHNPAKLDADIFYQVDVRDLVEHTAHLPPVVKRFYPPRRSVFKAMSGLGIGPELEDMYGVELLPNKHTVLEVRPLRALRPMLSTDNEFCALNLYQLALVATITYNDFGQEPRQRPIDHVKFPLNPSFGNLFAETLAGYQEVGRMKPEQPTPFYPVYEDVPYSKRFEILPFDPALYEQNRPDRGEEQEHPANINFFDDSNNEDGTDTQAFISHHDEIVLITVRGTQEGADFFRDGDALQVPFVGGQGKAHQGFHSAYLAIHDFVLIYLSKFYTGQKIIICGHSLGGAITTLLAEALRRNEQGYDVLLYTYGSPRAGDSTFVEGASKLVHHRIVNNNDPVPSVPSPWMDANWKVWVPGVVVGASNPYGWLLFYAGTANLKGDEYRHHGKQQHFIPVKFNGREESSILWDPGCESIEGAAICKLANKLYANGKNDMPDRAAFITQIVNHNDHYMVPSYVPFAWATFRRWQQTLEANQTIVTDREYRLIEKALEQQDREISREEARAPRAVNLRSREDGPSNLLSQLISERHRLNLTRARLSKLNATRLNPIDVYGSAVLSPTFEAGLERWKAHKENTAEVQLAAIPSEPDDVYIAGVYQDRDADSFT
ncbi:lipase family protein [Pseudomonas sp. 5S4]|uniref:lipase family protein n=2 Tax=Pseudomonas TaxID=286 RepID=UPI002B228B47|nr:MULTISPECIES: lipase family protein [unclassified Pseudomonas]MEB0199899.1 lipase family protein [Pseudomonas sp. 5S4]MEB0248122.1 lipase family protein [Pseudomonas sp. 10S5]